MDPYLHKLYVCVIDNGTQYMYVYWTMDNSREMLDLISYTCVYRQCKFIKKPSNDGTHFSVYNANKIKKMKPYSSAMDQMTRKLCNGRGFLLI